MTPKHRTVSFTRLSLRTALIGITLAGLGACNSNNRLAETNRALTDRNNALLAQLEECQNSTRVMREGLDERDTTIMSLRQGVTGLQGENRQMAQDMVEFDRRLTEMPFSQVDPGTDRELRRFANANPGLVEYDSNLGMLRFKSDLTFALGSTEVSSEAKQSLGALAGLLNGGKTSQYDIRVVGHTDNVPIKSTRPWKTNTELSCYRAISVGNELKKLGVAPTRIEPAGRGEYQPLVQNNTKGGTPENRRVELFLVRSITERASAMGAPIETSPRGGVAEVEDDFIK